MYFPPFWNKAYKCRFREKNINCQIFNSAEENCNDDRKNDYVSLNEINELTGHQNSADFLDSQNIEKCSHTFDD